MPRYCVRAASVMRTDKARYAVRERPFPSAAERAFSNASIIRLASSRTMPASLTRPAARSRTLASNASVTSRGGCRPICLSIVRAICVSWWPYDITSRGWPKTNLYPLSTQSQNAPSLRKVRIFRSGTWAVPVRVRVTLVSCFQWPAASMRPWVNARPSSTAPATVSPVCQQPKNLPKLPISPGRGPSPLKRRRLVRHGPRQGASVPTPTRPAQTRLQSTSNDHPPGSASA
jgi:hypothetical protein